MSQQDSLYIIVSDGSNNWIRKEAGPITRWLKRPVIDKAKHWVDEKINPVRWISEMVSSEYSAEMDVLRDVHKEITQWTKDLSDALDRAQDSRKQGKPIDAIFWLSQINNRLKLVTEEKNKLLDIQNKFIDTYFEQSDQDIPDDYFETGKHKIVEAGILNDLGREVATWKFQRSHKKMLMEQDRALVRLLNLAKSTVAGTHSFLSKMSKALGSGNISDYIFILEQISKLQDKFQQEFRSIYDNYFAATVERIKERKKQEQERANKIREEANQREKERLERSVVENTTNINPMSEQTTEAPISVDVPSLEVSPPTTKDPMSSVLIDVSTPSSDDLPISSAPDTEKIEEEEDSPNTIRSLVANQTELDKMILKMNHVKFYNELVKAANKNDPYILSAMLLKYSEMIDEKDPQKSLELISIAEGILNG